MDLWDVISSVGEEGADQSWWEALTGLNTDIDWEGLFSGIDLSGLDLSGIVGGAGSSYETGEGLPGEEAAAGSQGGGGGTGNILVGGGGSSYETGEGLPGEEAAAGSQGGSGGTGNILSSTDKLKGIAKTLGLTDEAGKINPAALLGLTGLLSMAGQGSKGAPASSGYQGTVPKYTAVRERVPIPQDPNRRPGAGGRRYFSDVSYVAPGATPAETQAAVDTARTAAKAQAEALKPALYPTPQVKAPEQEKVTEVIKPSYASGVAQLLPVPKYDTKGNVIVPGGQPVMPPAEPGGITYEPTPRTSKQTNELSELDAIFSSLPVSKLIEMFSSPPSNSAPPGGMYSARPDPIPPPTLPPKVEPTTTKTPENFSLVPEVPRTAPRSISGGDMLNIPIPAARGGLMELAKGRYLDGPTDGMEDKIPATISGKQPARLSHGEFVVPADVVSHLGNGNSNAGAQRLYDMMDRVRKARTGNPKQGKQINPNKYLPK